MGKKNTNTNKKRYRCSQRILKRQTKYAAFEWM